MAEIEVYDVIVVGAGIEGTATAYQLSRRSGVKVLQLEQYHLPHTRGSSHGTTRITRKAYPEAFYTDMMHYCMDEWKRLQRESSQPIFKQVGFMVVGAIDDPVVQKDMASMDQCGAPYKILEPDTFRKTYPQLSFPQDVGALFDPEGGILYAAKVLQTLQDLFVQQGGELRDGEKVERIIPGKVVHVTTSKGEYKARSLILCCGPWSNKVLKRLNLQLPLQPVRISVCFWPEKQIGAYSSDRFPSMKDAREDSPTFPHSVYGLPSEEYPGHMKLVLHHGPNTDAETRDQADSDWVVNVMKEYTKKHFPGLHPEPSIVESCIYTMTPDTHFILDHHPQWKNIVIGAGFSGHGFKLSPAVGNILADLALGLQPAYDMTPFSLRRFPRHTDSKL